MDVEQHTKRQRNRTWIPRRTAVKDRDGKELQPKERNKEEMDGIL